MKILIPCLFVFLISGPTLAQEQAPEGFYERPVSALQQTDIESETDRFGLCGDPPSSTPSTAPRVSFSIVLPRVSEAERMALEPIERGRGDPLQIGFGRVIPAEYRGDLAARLKWFCNNEPSVENGPMVAVLTVTSPEAAALRIGLRATLAAGATIHFSGLSDPNQRLRPFTHEDFDSSAPLVWSPVIEGDTVRMDVGLPSPAALSTFSLFLDRISHIVAPIGRPASDNLLANE